MSTTTLPPRQFPLIALHLPAQQARPFASGRAIAFLIRRQLRSRRASPRLVAAFRLHPRERAFALELLRRKSNFWLFRTHQGASCGDFVVVDMSSPDKALRPVWVVELKLDEPLHEGSGRVGNQLQNASSGLQRLVSRYQVADTQTPLLCLSGSAKAVLAHFCRPVRAGCPAPPPHSFGL